MDLDSLAGRFVTLRLRALGASVALVAPRIHIQRVQGTSVLRGRYNVILFVVDTLRADRLAVYTPNTRVRTPGLDRLAQHAIVFEHAFSPANWTKPSVATLMTGVQPWEHGATTHSAVLPDAFPLLSELLHDAGYHTAAFSTNGYVSSTFGFQRGWDLWRHHDDGPTHVRQIGAEVIRWIRSRPRDRPFFLYVHTTDCHAPYRPPQSTVTEYDPAPYRNGPIDFRRDPTLLAKIRNGTLDVGPRDRNRLDALYDGAVTHHDRYFERIMAEVDRGELANNTIVLFVADHGEEFFDHGSVGHGPTLWNELIRIPLVLRVPARNTQLRISEPVGSVDVLPTLLDLLDIDMPKAVRGQSLVPLIERRGRGLPAMAVSGITRWRSIVSGRFKLHLQDGKETPQARLYDLARDPGERDDIAADRPAVVRFLRRELELRTTRTSQAGPRVDVDPGLEDQLRALGYVGSQRAE